MVPGIFSHWKAFSEPVTVKTTVPDVVMVNVFATPCEALPVTVPTAVPVVGAQEPEPLTQRTNVPVARVQVCVTGAVELVRELTRDSSISNPEPAVTRAILAAKLVNVVAEGDVGNKSVPREARVTARSVAALPKYRPLTKSMSHMAPAKGNSQADGSSAAPRRP